MVKLDVAIDDRLWPKLTIVITRTDLNGRKHVQTRTHIYDSAYTQFENDLHNHLRPMVDQLISRRWKQ